MSNNRDQIKAEFKVELERLAAERLRLEETRRLRVIEERRARVLENILERYADLGERVTGLVALIRQRGPSEEATRIFLEELADRFDQFADILLLILSKIRNGKQLESAKVELKEQRRESLKRQLAAHIENLSVLQEQAANYGLNVPVHIEAEIRTTERKIRRIERVLG